MAKSGVMLLSGFIWPSGFMRLKVGKVGKSKEKWLKVWKNGEKCGKMWNNGKNL